MTENVKDLLSGLSSRFNPEFKDTAIILAAGHGKRIKSHTSKMLHQIWGVSTVERVFNATVKGLENSNSVIVVGIKAEEVAKTIGEKRNLLFAYQQEQNGTGHAVKVGMDVFDHENYDGTIYVFPGDMGLIDHETVKMFKTAFTGSNADMMVLTGQYEGKPEENSYGRIIRVKEFDVDGKPSGDNFNKVIEIMEHKDILALDETTPYTVKYSNQSFSYSRKELIENPEFNSGVYAFKSSHLSKLMHDIRDDNAQGEIYITDLISIFNSAGLEVSAVSPKSQYVIMGFNNKSVLKQMDEIARKNYYEQLKDIIIIDDPDDFYIAENVVAQIIEMDKKGTPLDIKIGKGVHIGKGVQLNYNVEFKSGVHVDGEVIFGRNVVIWENVILSSYQNQQLIIKDNVEILWGDIIKGNITIGENSRIESSVNITGSDDYPVVIGKNVIIKGTSYIFGSKIDDDMFIEHSVLIKKKLEKLTSENKVINSVKFYLPMPEGVDTITDI